MKTDVLKILVGSFLVGQLKGEIVNLLALCENFGEKVVRKGEVVTVNINGDDWSFGKTSCEVSLISHNLTDNLTYSFNEYFIDQRDSGTTITLQFIMKNFNTKTEYSRTSRFEPQIGRKYGGEPKLKIIVTRTSEFDKGVRASIDVAIKGDDYLEIQHEVVHLTAGQIAGIVIGIVALVAVIVILVVCIILIQRRRRSNPGMVIRAGHPHVTHQAVPHAAEP